MANAPDQTITGTFMSPTGEPLGNGYLVMRLSHDSQSLFPSQIVGSLTRRITLNSSGQINPAVAIYSNANLTPSGSFYLVRVFDSTGTLAVPLSQITIPASPNPCDLSTLTWTCLY